MHAKTDSWATSSAPSSPDHQRRPVYYVQSPPRDSHDEDKAATSNLESQTGSPTHLAGFHSRESSTSRFSGSLKPEQRRISQNVVVSVEKKNWKEYGGVIEEEGFVEDDESEKGLPRRFYFVAFVLGFFVLFSLFSLILWGASRHQKPKITMKSIKFERFTVQAGMDDSGVSTDMITVSSTVKFNYQNKGKFFGVHVSSTPLALFYSDFKIGSGDVEEFSRKRNRDKNVTVMVTGDKIPMYGAGASLGTPIGLTTLPVQLMLDFTVRSRAYVLGKLVKHRFYNNINCSIIFDKKKLNVPISLTNCKYDQ